jgi:hypothetical protein
VTAEFGTVRTSTSSRAVREVGAQRKHPTYKAYMGYCLQLASAVSPIGCHCICMRTTLSLLYWNLEGRRDNYFLLVLSSWCGTRPLSSSHFPHCLTDLHYASLSPSRSPCLKPHAHMVGKHLTPPGPRPWRLLTMVGHWLIGI